MLLLWAFTLLPAQDLTVQVAAPDAWSPLLSSVGLEGTTDPAAFRVLVGKAGEQVGVEPTGETVRVASLIDSRDSELPIFWQEPQELPVYSLPEGAKVFTREKRTSAPLVAGKDDWLWLAVPPGERAYQRFPYLIHALVDLGLKPPTRAANLWAFFDQAYRTRADSDYLARRWRQMGVAALHVSAWPFVDPTEQKREYLTNLIAACHREGVLVYAWLELPHVSEGFWSELPDCREKTATLADAQLDWRKLINLAEPRCFSTAAGKVRQLVEGFDWDGVNLAELYFESLHGPSNPARFTPLNPWVRNDAAGKIGFDPLELFDDQSMRFWSRNESGWRGFADYRADLALDLQRRFIELLREAKPDADLVVTQIEDRFDDRMRDFLGADAAALLPLADKYDFTLLIEDPATMWSLGPERYPKIAEAYHPLTRDPARLAIDINIVERYQQTYPTRKQTGGELLELVQLASSAFQRVALYFEHSIAKVDAKLLPHSAAPPAALSREGEALVVESKRPIGVSWKGEASVNGRPWPIADRATLWLPAGRHEIEPSSRQPPARVLHLNAELLSAKAGSASIDFEYYSKARTLALIDRQPAALEIDSNPAELELQQTKTHWTLTLPRGHHCVKLRF